VGEGLADPGLAIRHSFLILSNASAGVKKGFP
jgi:hypothetical protein